MENKKQPPILAAQNKTKEYHKPSFEVIDLNIQSPLLAGSGTDGTAGFSGVKKGIK